MNEVKFDMPTKIEDALGRLAATAKAAGYPSMHAIVVDGELGHVSLFDRDRRQRFVWRDEKGRWYECINVEG